jgi:hypothetical protein
MPPGDLMIGRADEREMNTEVRIQKSELSHISLYDARPADI